MKKITLAFAMALLAAGLNVCQAQIKVTGNGNVGIGLGSEIPVHKLQVNGNANITRALSSGNLTLTQTLNVGGSSYLQGLSFGKYFTSFEKPVGFSIPYTPDNYGFSVTGGTILTPKTAYLGSIGEKERPLGVIHAGELRLYPQSVTNGITHQLYAETDRDLIFVGSPGSFGKFPGLMINRYRLKPETFDKMEDGELRQFCIENALEYYDITAESLAEYFPELVNQNKEDNSYQVNYLGLIPYLVDALQEAYTRISELELRTLGYNPPYEPELRNMSANRTSDSLDFPDFSDSDSSMTIKTKSQTIPLQSDDSSATAEVENTLRLHQNVPNPFTQNTRIDFYLPNTVRQADLYVYNMNGAQVMHFPITERGEGNITIQGQTLAAGMYLYVLIADNVASEAKRMILTD